MAEPARCCGCGAPVTKDEIAVTKRLINRGTDRFYCRPCLAGAFGITVPDVDRCIRRFKEAGCTLFL